MKKSNIKYMIISITLFLVLVASATFAYFSSSVVTGNGLNLSISTDENNVAFAASGGTLSLEVKAEDMLQTQIGQGDALASEKVGDNNMIVTLSSGNDTPIACSYNIYFQWNTDEAYLTPTDATKKELTLELNLEDEDGTGGDGNNRFASETQITKVVNSINKTVVVQGAVIVGSESNPGMQTWIPTIRFYNLTNDQSALAGKTFGGKFTIDDVVCDVSTTTTNVNGTLAGLVSGMVSNSEYTSSQDGTPYVVKHETVEYNGQTLDAGIRYAGADPDNYVEFNDGEEWRIIGTFEGSTIGLEPGKWYTKIISSTSYIIPIGGVQELNSFLSEIKQSSMIASYNGNYSTWYVIAADISEYAAYTASNFYVDERNSGRTKVSPINLMYPSDFGFSLYGLACDPTKVVFNNADCVTDSWLAQYTVGTDDIERVLSTIDSTERFYVQMSLNSGILFAFFTNAGASVRPTLYLESDIYITSGNGSKANPYKIAEPSRTLSETVLDLENESEYTSSQDQTKYVVKHEEVEYNGTTLDAGVRYEGKDPNNYVRFNGDEEWRIIGTFEGSTIGLESGKQYTRIIKSESIGNLVWDDNENDWTNSMLNAYLNGEYFKSLSDSSKIAQYNGKYSTWHLRGEPLADFATADWYLIERATGVPGYRNRIQGAADVTNQSAIALMYPSDYGYAAYGEGCTRTVELSCYDCLIDSYGNEVSQCAALDWLAYLNPNTDGSYLLLSPYTDSSSMIYIYNGGNNGYLTTSEISSSGLVQPTLYLEHDILITDGSGTKADPYVLK